MGRWVWVAVVAACLLVLWLQYPAQGGTGDCTMVRDAVRSIGPRAVRQAAVDLGYTRAQMAQFRRYCARMGIFF